MSGARPRQVPVPHRPPRAGARPRARRGREPRQRQADQGEPRRRRAAGRRLVLLLRRLGRQARLRRARRRPALARRRRPGHPVELPAADARVEDRPGARRRQHRRAQAGRDHAAVGADLRRDPAAGRPAARRRQHHHRRGRHRRGAGATIRTSTRSPSPARPPSAARSPRPIAGTGKKLTLELGGKAANIVFDDAPIDQAIEGIVNGIFFNQGHVCCAGQPAARAGEHPRRGRRPPQAAAVDAAPGRPARQEHRHRRDQLARAARPHPRRSATSARRRAPSAGRADCVIPDNGFWFAPTIFTNVSTSHRDRPRGDLRAGAVGADLPHPGRGDREGEQHAVRPVRRHLDRQGQPRSSPSPTSCAPA